MNPQTEAVQAIHVKTDEQRRAFAVVDAVDFMEHHLRPFRAIEALAQNELADAPESLAQLQRSDLAALMGVLTGNVEARCAEVRAAAMSLARPVV